ncbi:Replicase polyprotein 1ab [Frankliniella fusca]|uniref:Replicase polyprotein 1ab n=1 Tax=Frankliniella fusca TaxID=407009 RepID=A0AAE1LII8_9NEOP|nr:Replicase polyprotein 1ab [Frankliniella fusca]
MGKGTLPIGIGHLFLWASWEFYPGRDGYNVDGGDENPQHDHCEPPYSLLTDDSDMEDAEQVERLEQGLQEGENQHQQGVQQEAQEDIPPPIGHVTHSRLRRKLLEEDFCEPITTPVTASPAQALLMALAAAQQNRSTFKAFVDSTKCINSLFLTPVLPKSEHLLDELLNSSEGFNRFFFCSGCSYLFGKIDHVANPSIVCPVDRCKTSNNIKDLTKATYFLQYDLVPQLQSLLGDEKVFSKLVNPKDAVQMSPPHVLTEIYSGKCYQNFADSVDGNENNISLSFCTDGTPLFKSSNLSIWPVFLSVNELPPTLRMKHLLLGGLWFSSSKPHMDLFLIPLVSHLSHLPTTGFTINVTNVALKFKAFTIACCVDSGARGAVQVLNSHSGYYSCNWCEQPGEYIDNAVRFPYLETHVSQRTHDRVIDHGAACLADDSLEYVFGVRGHCPLKDLPKFNLVHGFVQDFPHNVPYGIGRMFLHEWKSNTNRGYHIGAPDDIEDLNEKMKCLTPPIEKALSENDVETAHRLLVHFVCGVQNLYGKGCMTYNVHILTHLAESVDRWGPVWALSTYSFESGNGELKAIIHAQRGIPHQIQRFISEKEALKILISSCSSQKTEEFLESIQSKPKIKRALRVGESTVLFGCHSCFNPTDEELFLCNELDIDPKNCVVYKKVIFNKTVYIGQNSRERNKQNDNSVASLKSRNIVLLKYFIFDGCNEKVYFLCKNLNLTPYLKFPPGVLVSPEDHCTKLITHQSARLRLLSIEELESI